VDSGAFSGSAARLVIVGREAELRGLDALAGERLQAGFDAERADDSSGQVAGKVVHPVAAVRPAAGAVLRTAHVERLDEARVAERHDSRREARGDLAHALHLALRREGFDGHAVRRCGEGEGEEGGARATRESDHCRGFRAGSSRCLRGAGYARIVPFRACALHGR